jgi:hypothetical protein
MADQSVEGGAGGGGDPRRDPREQGLERLPVQRHHQAFERGAGGQDDARRQQQRLRAFDQFGGPQPVGRQIGQALHQAGLGVRRERREAEMRAYPRPDRAVGRLPRRGHQPGRRRREADLAGEMDDGLVRDAAGIVGEAPAPAQAAQMQRGPQAAQAAGAMDLPEVGLGQRPVAQQRIGIGLVARGARRHVSRRG